MSAGLKIVLIGFGEAGRSFASGWKRDAVARVSAFDIKTDNPAAAAEMVAAYRDCGVAGAASAAEALEQAELIFCLVPADQSLIAAMEAAPHLPAGSLWIDGTSSAPQKKRAASDCVTAAGARYVDMAIMAPVEPKGHRTATLISGPQADSVAERLRTLNMVTSAVGEAVGDASSIKMFRSVMIKGMEALTAECLLAARRAGVEAAVIGSLEASNPEIAWRDRSIYNLERMSRHGLRRAAEMREVAATLRDLGLPDRLATATALWQDHIGAMGLHDAHQNLEAALDTLLEKME